MKPLIFALSRALIIIIAPFSSAADSKIELKKGDRICPIGNALAGHMQHDGYLEVGKK